MTNQTQNPIVDAIRLETAKAIIEQRLDMLATIQAIQTECGYSDAHIAKLAQLAGMKDIASILSAE